MSDKTKKTTRKEFLAGGGTLLGGSMIGLVNNMSENANASELMNIDLNQADNIIYSSCLNCNTGCGIKVKIKDGITVKIDGNPYNPFNRVDHLPMKTAVEDAARIDAALCPKGQAGIQIQYDPYRIRKVLKRAGKRGDNKWITVPFDQAVKEIVEGGKLFSGVKGEEDRVVEGLKSIMALKKKDDFKAMKQDVAELWKEKDKDKKKKLVEDFKVKHKDNLGKLIDPEHPDLGPKNNQFVIAWGRLKGGRSNFINRFGNIFGTTNLHGHTTVCQGSLYFTCKALSEQYKHGKFSDGKKFYWQTDLENAKFVLFAGSNLLEANYGPTNRSPRLMENLSSGQTSIAVADPRFSKLASKAKYFLPVKPGEDAALAMAIIRWIIENEKYDANFLKCTGAGSAEAAKEKSYSNGSWLVELKDGKPGKFARAALHGLAAAQNRTEADPKDKNKFINYTEEFLIAMVNGVPTAIDPNNKFEIIFGDLFVDAKLPDGTQVKSSLQLLKESAFEKTIDEWCAIAGVDPITVKQVAKELTSYGKQASVDVHRGPAQHTNGFYNILAWMSINILIGNFDWKGGMSAPSAYSFDGAKGGLTDLSKIPGKLDSFGISSIRHDVAYDKTTIFSGYPAKRNWYPIASDVYEEIIPSIGDAYPYPVKALFLYMGSPAYSLPAGQTNIDVIADVKKLPLFISSDILVGTTSMYSDYIFPDLGYLERWEFQGTHPNMVVKVGPIRQPVSTPIPEIVTVYGEKVPISLESTLMAFAEKLGLKGFGKNGLGEGIDFNHQDDFYIRAVANIALGDKPGKEVPEASDQEIEYFLKARKHLPATVFSADRWKKISGDAWKRVVYLLNRGGRFDKIDDTDSPYLKNSYASGIQMYQEKTAGNKYSGTGKSYPGIAKYVPQKNYAGESLEKLHKGYDLHLITHRTVSQTKSRTIASYWLNGIMPENGIIISPQDAKKIGVSNDDKVKVISSTNTEGTYDLKNGNKKSMIGKIIISETIRPGVVSFVLGFGHWATGSTDIELDGKTIKGDERRGRGVHANAAMWTDSSLRNNTCMLDPVGGSVSFYDTRVKLVKVLF